MKNAHRQLVETSEYKQAMEQQNNKRFFPDGRTFTGLVNELYLKIGQAIKELGLAYSGK